MSEANEVLVVVNVLTLLANLGMVFLNVKLYTEFVKEAKYREPKTKFPTRNPSEKIN